MVRTISRPVGRHLQPVQTLSTRVKHNDKQTPRVTTEEAQVSHTGTDYIEIRIADNGPGIADSEVTVLKRGYETELEHSKGLGLWLANWIITNASGEMRFEENEPEGSVICLRVKRATEERPSFTTANSVETPG